MVSIPLGAFLIPYGLIAMLYGIPMFLLETSIGQFTQEGFVTCWQKLCPLVQGDMIPTVRFPNLRNIKHTLCCVEGIGYGHLVMKFYDFSYILIEVWAVFYLMFSFRWPLPWATCENPWNTGPV